jgi:hypothetical protein
MDISAVWLTDTIFLACSIAVCTLCTAVAYFMYSPRLSLTHTVCLQSYFLVSRPDMGGRQFPSIPLCLYPVALNFYCASNVLLNPYPVNVGKMVSS